MRTVLIVALWLAYYGLGDRVPPLPGWANLGLAFVTLACVFQDDNDIKVKAMSAMKDALIKEKTEKEDDRA